MVGDTSVTRTMCPMNCHPTLCGMMVKTRDGEVLSVRGDKAHPDSRGFLCVRGQATKDIVGNPKRLLYPLIRERRGTDAWREAGWDEVLDRIAGAMRAAGRERTALWTGHGNLANGYGVRAGGALVARFANLYGCQQWSPAMICWGLGGFGLGLTGALDVTTKEDMGANAELILMWGANLASQPNTARHLIAAHKRGAHIVTIDVRPTEAAAQSDEVFILRPGSDAALALAMMHVVVAEELYDAGFVADHTIGFEALRDHVRGYTPEWAAAETGIAAERIVALARRFAGTRPATIVVGGSSLHKGRGGWQSARAISCLPALTGDYGRPGGGLGERHGAKAHGAGFGDISAAERRPPGTYVANQMSEIADALDDGRIGVLALFGVNMLSSFADSARLARALDKLDLVVCHDLFMNETIRDHADIVLPGTTWLEDLGAKATHGHVYLAEQALPPAGEARAVQDILRGLADRLEVADLHPWADQEGLLDALLDHPATGHATVRSLRENGGKAALRISPHAYPDRKFHTPSGKIEFYSEQAAQAGLPPLPEPEASDDDTDPDAPLTLAPGRTLTQFHAFYDHGRALPLLVARDGGPELWISETDATARGIYDGAAVRVFNQAGDFETRARITDGLPTGTLWIRDGTEGLNRVTSGAAALPEAALDLFPFTVGQARYDARVEVEALAG